MYLYDKIIASGLYAFQDNQKHLTVSNIITFLKIFGLKLSRNDLKLVELRDKVCFQDFKFFLKDDILIDDVNHLVDPYFVVIFQYIKNLNKENKEEKTEKIIGPKKY